MIMTWLKEGRTQQNVDQSSSMDVRLPEMLMKIRTWWKGR
jgi:hypothetical protein